MSIQLFWREQPVAGVTIWSSLLEEESAKLRELAQNKLVLEIGAAFGFSTLTMASVAAHVWSCDSHDITPAWGLFGIQTQETMAKYSNGTLPILKGNLSESGLEEKVTVCVGSSQAVLAAGADLTANLQGLIDLAFIDGDHRFWPCLTDLMNCARIVRKGGVITVHDYDESANPEVKVAVDAWKGQRPFELFGTLAVIQL